MKIAAIIKAPTTAKSITLRTDPKLSKEVFDALKKRIVQTTVPHTTPSMTFSEGLLIVTLPVSIPDFIPFLEQNLTDAEKQVAADQKATDKQREDLLNELSQRFNLPLE